MQTWAFFLQFSNSSHITQMFSIFNPHSHTSPYFIFVVFFHSFPLHSFLSQNTSYPKLRLWLKIEKHPFHHHHPHSPPPPVHQNNMKHKQQRCIHLHSNLQNSIPNVNLQAYYFLYWGNHKKQKMFLKK